MQTKLLAAIGTILLAACAGVQRKPLGHVEVRVLHPIINTQVYDTISFGIEEGRLFASSPFNATQFDMAVINEEGCIRGSGAGTWIIDYCPASKALDESGAQHWRGRGISANRFFSTALRDGGRRLEIETPDHRAEIQLGESAADDEIRKHPALLGLAFSFQLFPASKDEPGSDAEHREWKYVLSAR